MDVKIERELTSEEIKMFREAFASFDRNGDGKISLEELQDVLGTLLGQAPDEDGLQKIMNEIDTDRSGTIEFSEFLELMQKKFHAETENTDVRDAFEAIDTDNDGLIGPREMMTVMAKLGQPITEVEAKEMIEDADLDKDGKLNYDEFQRIMMWEDRKPSSLFTSAKQTTYIANT
ncbi:neo-calmodulin-like [Tubulanus polymorphus]|uniref:neo-calmodulin-like n=1 Tax=Tubulanus polymorphus TaxID=672921 RepID=UPI003DA35A42